MNWQPVWVSVMIVILPSVVAAMLALAASAATAIAPAATPMNVVRFSISSISICFKAWFGPYPFGGVHFPL